MLLEINLRNAATYFIPHIMCFPLIRRMPLKNCCACWRDSDRVTVLLNAALSVHGRICNYNIKALDSVGSDRRSDTCEDILKDWYETMFSKAISGCLEGEQKGRVHWETERASLHDQKWDMQSKTVNHLKGFYRLQIWCPSDGGKRERLE